jgi:uncharacterized cupin superfamily protein
METRLRHLTDIVAATGPAPSVRPEWFAGNHEAKLGQAVGVTQFGVNHVILEPGAASALRHWHEGEDEFVYVLSGQLTLIDETGEHALAAGSFVGFPAGEPNGHHLVNRSKAPATFLSVGTRKPGLETVHYPDDFAEPRTVLRDAAGRRMGA